MASIPPHAKPGLLQKVWILRSYLKEEVGVNANIVVVNGKGGKPKIIALGEVIDLDEDLTTIVRKITANLAYDVGDPKFLDKVAIGGSTD